MNRIIQFIAVTLALGIMSTLSSVAAARGEARSTEFRSPMVLETQFSPTLSKTMDITEWADYYCDDVAIKSLHIRRKKLQDGFQEFDLVPKLTMRPGTDKIVSLTFEIVSGDSVVARTFVGNIKAGDDEESDDKAVRNVPILGIPADKLIVLAPPTLRITVTVASRR